MKRLKITSLWIEIKERIHRPLLLLFLLSLLCCILYSHKSITKLSESPEFAEHRNITIKGKIRDLEYGEGDSIKTITVGGYKCYVNEIEIAKSLEISDTVLIKGNITKINPPENPGEFDSFKYELSKKVKYKVFPESVTVINRKRFSIKSYFKTLNHSMSEHLIKRAPRSGGTISTILLGDKRSLPETRKDLFSYVSLSFFLVISGLHVSFIAALINRTFKGITGSYKVSLSMTVLFILSYGLLTGFTVSVKRAVIMYFIKALAEYLNKNYDSLSALSLAGIIELISNPFSVYSISFIYSYSAVFIIGFFYSYVLPDIPKEYFRKRSFQILKLPVFLMLFMPFVSLILSQEFSFAGMFINLILSLITLPLLAIGMVVLLLSFTGLTGLTLYMDFCEGLIIRLIDLMCIAGSKLNFLRVTGMPSWINIFLYLITAITAVLMLKRRFLMLSFLIMTVSINLLTHRFFLGPVVTFLSVGQGDSAVIQTGKREAILIDTGSTSGESPGEYILIPFLKHEGIERLEKVFLSHGDLDHVSGVQELINKEYSGIEVKEIVFPDVGFNETFESIERDCNKNRIRRAI